jgi:hypothetical protein
MVELDYMIITGGGDGIMGAAQRGAGREKSFGLNIRLPFEQRANEVIHGDEKLINFNYFFTRKLNFVKETHAVALFPGGFGTMDEGFEVLTLMQTGKGRIFPWSSSIRPAATIGKRGSLGQKMVVRLQRRLTGKSVDSIEVAFDDILNGSCFEQGAALPEEQNEPEIAHLPAPQVHAEAPQFRPAAEVDRRDQCRGGGGGRRSRNIQHPTSNTQHSIGSVATANAMTRNLGRQGRGIRRQRQNLVLSKEFSFGVLGALSRSSML